MKLGGGISTMASKTAGMHFVLATTHLSSHPGSTWKMILYLWKTYNLALLGPPPPSTLSMLIDDIT